MILGALALGGGFWLGWSGSPVPPTSAPPQAPAAQTATAMPEVSATPTSIPTAVRMPPDTPVPTRSPSATPPVRPTITPTAPAPRPTATAAEPALAVEVLPEVSHIATTRPVVALTFDAGGDAGSTALTLRILRERGVKATFFVTGRFAEQFPTLVREMVLDGHELANHTYDHKDLEGLSNAQIAAELERTDGILRGFTGATTRPLMRAPFGSRDTRVRAAIASAGYRSIYWAIDGGDWKPGATAGGVIAAVRKAKAGDVVVQHCATAPTAAALPAIFDDFARRGLTVVTVSTLLAG